MQAKIRNKIRSKLTGSKNAEDISSSSTNKTTKNTKNNKNNSNSNNNNNNSSNGKIITNKNNKNNKNNKRNNNTSKKIDIDHVDSKIIQLVLSNQENLQISRQLAIPLSTIQRRIRKLFEKEILRKKVELNYEGIGYKRGMLHIYLDKGLLNGIGKIVASKPGILSVSVHVGNSDLVAVFIYKNSTELLEIIRNIKEIEGIEKVLWSEEVYTISANTTNENTKKII